MDRKQPESYYKMRREARHIETKKALSFLEKNNNKFIRALQDICNFDLKPYENEKLHGADKLKMIAFEALK